MRDGVYAVSLTAYHYAYEGRLVVENDRARGRDEALHVDIELRGSGNGIQGLARIRRPASASEGGDLPGHVVVDMIGSGGSDTFNLIGTGPRGVIIEINAVRTGDAAKASLE